MPLILNGQIVNTGGSTASGGVSTNSTLPNENKDRIDDIDEELTDALQEYPFIDFFNLPELP